MKNNITLNSVINRNISIILPLEIPKIFNYTYLEDIYLDLTIAKICVTIWDGIYIYIYIAMPLHQKQLAWKFVNLEAAVMREKVISTEMSANVILCAK